MKTVLFCGGQGTRIGDSFSSIPKPLIPIGQKPVLLHLMNYYRDYGHADFVLCLGYKGQMIKDFFLAYREWMFSDCVVKGTGGVELLDDPKEQWTVSLVDTGLERSIGERLWAVQNRVCNEDMFLANYADA